MIYGIGKARIRKRYDKVIEGERKGECRGREVCRGSFSIRVCV
jgi:hypothetical protein